MDHRDDSKAVLALRPLDVPADYAEPSDARPFFAVSTRNETFFSGKITFFFWKNTSSLLGVPLVHATKPWNLILVITVIIITVILRLDTKAVEVLD